MTFGAFDNSLPDELGNKKLKDRMILQQSV